MLLQLSNRVKVTIVFDNNPFAPKLKTAWGFACVAHVGSKTVLFDTGSDGTILLENMRALDILPSSIDAVLISHNHWDHIGGLEAFLNVHPAVNVFIPASFAPDVKKQIANSGGLPVEIDVHRASECKDGSCCVLAEQYGVRAVPSLVVDGKVDESQSERHKRSVSFRATTVAVCEADYRNRQNKTQ